MSARLRTFSPLGIEAVPVEVEVDESQAEFPEPAASLDLLITLGVLSGSGQLSFDRFEYRDLASRLNSALTRVDHGKRGGKTAL